MDAPGFPEGPESPVDAALLWGLLALLIVASVVVTVVAYRRGERHGAVVVIGVIVVALGLVAAAFMWLPAYVFASPTGGGTCPIDAMSLALMAGDHASEFYRYWQPCRNASRRNIGLALGGFALLAGVGGFIQLRLSQAATHVPVRA